MQETPETQVRSLGQRDPRKRKWQPTPVFLSEKSHGQRSLAGYSPWGCRESDMTGQLSTHDVIYHIYIYVERERERKSYHTLLAQRNKPEPPSRGSHTTPWNIKRGPLLLLHSCPQHRVPIQAARRPAPSPWDQCLRRKQRHPVAFSPQAKSRRGRD